MPAEALGPGHLHCDNLTAMDEGTPADPTLTVLIAVRDGAQVIPPQLEALARQEFGGTWELVLADNGSRDDTVAVVEGFADRLPALRVVDASARPGQAYAINEGARAARGRSILLLDADDLVQPGYLAAMAAALEENSLVAARLDCQSLNPPWLWSSRPPTQIDGIGSPFAFLPSAAGCSIGIARAAFEEVGGFDDTIMLGTDVDLCWRVQLAGHELHFVPDAVVGYRYRETLRGIFAQARTYGTAGPALYRRYRDRGMPRRPWRTALRFHAAALVRLVQSRSRSDLAACAFLFGYRFGLVTGCIENRVLYL
jgi:GT2 family glycosyltransferase